MRQSLVVTDVFARYLSTALSFLILFFLVRTLSIQDFALFQVGYAFGAIALWVGDFGLGVKILIHLSRKQIAFAQETWYLRLVMVISALAVAGIVGTLVGVSFDVMLFIAASLDLLSDSHLNLRQVTASKKNDLFFQAGKRLIQLLFLSVLKILDIRISSTSLLLVIGIPSVLLILKDSYGFGTIRISNIKYHLTDSWKKWFQSGGTAIVNLDYIILGFTGNYLAITTLALAKKIFNGIAIIGTALFPRILYEVASKSEFTRENAKDILRTIGFACLPTCFAIFFLKDFLTIVWGFNSSSSQLWLCRTLLILTPLYFVSLALNSVLLGLNLNRFAAISTYTSGVMYLCVLLTTNYFQNTYLVISCALIVNATSWMLIEMYLLHLFNKNPENVPNRRNLLK
jgi:O-antigen/teichoic acid export membrane protein